MTLARLPQSEPVEQAARIACAYIDPAAPDRLPRRRAYPIIGAMSLALWGVVLGISYVGWP